VLGIVQTVDGLEHYRVGPDTILLSVDVYEDLDGNLLAEYTIDLGKGDASGGTIPFSERELEAERWRPAVEALELVSLLPLPSGAQHVGAEWTVRSRHSVPGLGLRMAETTGFSIESIEGEEVAIRYSAVGSGSTTISQPYLGRDANKQVTLESTRQGTFVFDVGEGRVLSAERSERLMTTSVFYLGPGDAGGAQEESETLTLQLFPFNDSR
jgi:hypothetical protein